MLVSKNHKMNKVYFSFPITFLSRPNHFMPRGYLR